MAGGKESPRQKMIGMMYLVLTALLALQIKDTVLEKFVLIENGLVEANVAIFDYNQAIVADIQSDVVNQGNKQGDQSVGKAAQNIRNYTNGMIQYLEDLKVELGEVSAGSKNREDFYTRAVLKKYEPQSNVMVTNMKAEELKERLDAYPQQVNAAISSLGKGVMDEEWAQSLAIKAEDIDFYSNNPDALREDYAHFNFYKAPLASVLAQLTFYQNQLYSKESEALNYVADLIGSGVSVSPDDVPDLGGLAPVEAAESSEDDSSSSAQADNTSTSTPPVNNSSASGPSSIPSEDMLERAFAGIDYAQATVLSPNNTVTAGLDFQAEALLTLGNSALQPTIRLNGEEIDVVNGRGVISFPARAGANEYDANNLAEKSFEIEIEAADGSGEIIKRTTTHNYSVARPVIEVVAKSVQALYRDCANNVTINVPSLGPSYNPSFQMTGGSFDKGSGKGEVLISPTGNEASIQVYSSGLFIGNKTFPVRSAPAPEIEVLTNGQPYDPEKGFSGGLNEISFLFNVDPDWKESFPNDASYLVSKGQILIQRGSAVAARINIDSPDAIFNVGQYRNLLNSGANVIVKVEEIIRINYEGKQIRSPKFANATIRIN